MRTVSHERLQPFEWLILIALLTIQEWQRILLNDVKFEPDLLTRLLRKLVQLKPLHEVVLLLLGIVPSIHMEESTEGY